MDQGDRVTYDPRLVLKDDKKFWKIKVMVSFHLFEYNNSDVIELFAYDKSTGKDFNRMCFSKSAILGIGTLRDSIGKIFEERLAAMSIVRGKSAGSNFEVGDELILRDIQDRMLGEYILAHISLEEVQSSARNKSASYEIQFCPPDEHDPAKLVIFRPPELGDIEPYRDIEMQSSSSFKLSSLKGSVARQRKVSVSENVICAFKNALLSGLLRDYNMHGSSTTAATFSTPAKRKFQRSVKKIMMQNAVAKVTSLLTQHDADKTPAVPPAVTDPKSGVKRPARRRTLGALTEDNRRKSYMGPAATDLHRPVLPAPSSRSKLRMTDLQQDSSSIEKEVIMTEKVIEAFHAAVLNSLDANISKETKCESYKTSVKAVPTALAASSKTRWQRSIKKVMLQKAVEKVSDMLSHSAVEKNSSHTADEVVHTDQGPAKIKSCADGHLVHVPDIHSRSGAPSTLKTENLSSAPIISKEMFRSRSAAAAPKQAKTQTRVIEKEDSLRLFPIL